VSREEVATMIAPTHAITSAVLRAGAANRPCVIRRGVAGNILMAWVLTFPGAAAIAAVSQWIVHEIVPA
jgi:inorganic phosphate transporter, PiT family